MEQIEDLADRNWIGRQAYPDELAFDRKARIHKGMRPHIQQVSGDGGWTYCGSSTSCLHDGTKGIEWSPNRGQKSAEGEVPTRHSPLGACQSHHSIFPIGYQYLRSPTAYIWWLVSSGSFHVCRSMIHRATAPCS